MMVLVTGGASSGKSAFAERVAQAMAPDGARYYLAAMKPQGPEAFERIERHRALRAGKGFSTVECHGGLGMALAALAARAGAGTAHAGTAYAGTALLECLGNVVANELFPDEGPRPDPASALSTVVSDMAALADTFENLVIVGNEVGSDGVRYDDATEAYIRVLGAASCALAQRCDVVVEVVCGQPLFVKGSLAL